MEALRQELRDFYVEVCEAGFGCVANKRWSSRLDKTTTPSEVAALLLEVEVGIQFILFNLFTLSNPIPPPVHPSPPLLFTPLPPPFFSHSPSLPGLVIS